MEKLIWGLRMEVIATQLPLFQLDQTSVSVTDEKSTNVNNIEAYKNLNHAMKYMKKKVEREREREYWVLKNRFGVILCWHERRFGFVVVIVGFDRRLRMSIVHSLCIVSVVSNTDFTILSSTDQFN